MISDSDKQILNLLINGDTAKEIAVKVNLSVWAVNRRIERMKKKHQVKTKVQLVANYLTSLS